MKRAEGVVEDREHVPRDRDVVRSGLLACAELLAWEEEGRRYLALDVADGRGALQVADGVLVDDEVFYIKNVLRVVDEVRLDRDFAGTRAVFVGFAPEGFQEEADGTSHACCGGFELEVFDAWDFVEDLEDEGVQRAEDGDTAF